MVTPVKGRVGRATSRSGETPAWIRTFEENTSAMERELETLVRERPAALLAGALTLGVAGYFLLNRSRSSRPSARGSARSRTSGVLARNFTPTLIHIHEQLNRLPIRGFQAVKTDIALIAQDELATRPWQSLGAALALGFGLGGMNRQQVTRGALRLIQLLALKSVDEPFSIHPQPEGALHEYDPQQSH